MKYVENIQSVSELEPDYMGFIFYERSKRNFEGIIPELPKRIKKTGVFVNEPIEILVSLVQEYQLEAVQLHGDESIEYIEALKGYLKDTEVIKVFGIKDHFNFSDLEPYITLVDYFLFDTKGKERGGSGIKFNWSVLEDYPYTTPFFLSGGIGVNDVEEIEKIKTSALPIFAIDVNSKFESKPGYKEIKKLRAFKKALKI